MRTDNQGRFTREAGRAHLRSGVVHVGTLIREHVKDLGDFMARDPRGQKLPVYIAQLGEHLANEQTILSRELEVLRKKH